MNLKPMKFSAEFSVQIDDAAAEFFRSMMTADPVTVLMTLHVGTKDFRPPRLDHALQPHESARYLCRRFSRNGDVHEIYEVAAEAL